MVDAFCNLGPTNAIPENIAKEWMSLCYVRAVIAQAGLNIGKCEWDDGVDLTVRADKAILKSFIDASSIGLQLKATKNWEIYNEALIYRVKAKTYERLISENRQEPLFLVLYPLPPQRKDWLTYAGPSANHTLPITIFQHTGYFTDLRGQPPLAEGEGSKEVSIPLANHFTQDSLIQLFKRHLDDMEIAIAAVKNAHAHGTGGER